MKDIICLLGPTASGKTQLAVEMVEHLPCEIVSVDSAMIYRGMDIGTAKPDANILKIAPHRLIDIRDPSENYSAGQFCQDALQEIEKILAKNKIPLLVGGSMMYFRVLQQGIAELPKADQSLRKDLETRAREEGLASLHAFLQRVDAKAAERININDGKRIQRALEVYLLTGKTMSSTHKDNTYPLSPYRVHNLGLNIKDRVALHKRIELRFDKMLKQGLIEEVSDLYHRGDLNPNLSSMLSVGYKQIWHYLSNLCSYDEMREKSIAATRQLAKRQMTWLRSWPNLNCLEMDAGDLYKQMQTYWEKTENCYLSKY